MAVEKGVMRIAGRGTGKDFLEKLPAAPAHLSESARAEFTHMGGLLIKAERLKAHLLGTLEGWADAYAQWQWATARITEMNKKKMGSGYVQTYKSKATNITTEMVVKKDALNTMLACSKLFGLDPKSEKELKQTVDPAQGNLFEHIRNALTS